MATAAAKAEIIKINIQKATMGFRPNSGPSETTSRQTVMATLFWEMALEGILEL